jgi:hypothetical protein
VLNLYYSQKKEIIMKTRLLSIVCCITLTCYAVNSNAQANTKLSNLVSPTAVNVNLLPGGTTGTKNLGSDTKRWKNGYFNGAVVCYGVGNSYGVYGTSSSYGVLGRSSSIGVYGAGGSYGVYASGSSRAVWGHGGTYGVYGDGSSYGVYGSGGTYGVLGSSSSSNSWGVFGQGRYGVGGAGSTYGIYGYSSTSTGWAGYFQGKVYSTGGYTTSDQRLKQNIRDFTSAMDIINKLKPKQYEFRQDGNYKLMNLPGGSHFGLIAQDVQKVLPNLVNDTKFETAMAQPQATEAALQKAHELGKTQTQSEIIEFKTLNYTELIPVLIKGMQELSAINDEKDAKINNLQKQIDELKVIVLRSNSQTGTNTKIANASLAQNAPNPFTNATTIKYTLPSKFTSAQILITDKNGKQLKQLNISGSSNGTLRVDASTLSSGTYNYSLVIYGKIITTKQMAVLK